MSPWSTTGRAGWPARSTPSRRCSGSTRPAARAPCRVGRAGLGGPRGHRLADPGDPVDLRHLRETSRWMAAPSGEPSRRAVDLLLAGVGGAPPVPWEFEGLGTILSLVARGIG